jgi:hypothetical protein
MRDLHLARLEFGKPFVDSSVPMFSRTGTAVDASPMGQNDIAKIRVRNVPYDPVHGRPVEDAFARVEIFSQFKDKLVLPFDYPRWEENRKPFYHDHPRDHYPHEWNRRSLPPSGEWSTLNFLVKSIDEEKAYGFRGRSQLLHMWHDPELQIPPGRYLVRIVVFGIGLRSEAEQWLSLDIGGRGQSVNVEKR